MKEKVFCDINGMFKRSFREITESGSIFKVLYSITKKHIRIYKKYKSLKW